MINCEFENGNKASLRHVTVGCLVIKGGDILLAKRNGKLLEGGKWCLPGGFVNRDETLAEAAKREAFEETGYGLKDLTLFHITDIPDRPGEDRQNIAFNFLGQAGDKTGKSDWESDELKWFSLDSLPTREEVAFDHFDEIELYQRYIKTQFSLPVIGK